MLDIFISLGGQTHREDIHNAIRAHAESIVASTKNNSLSDMDHGALDERADELMRVLDEA